jgi:hypothetical protein
MALSFSVPDTELSLTLHNRRAEVIDQILRGTPFLNAMRTRGGMKDEDGGLEIVQPLRISKNTTAGSFDGYDILDTTPQDQETSARFPWAQEYVTITLAWTEEMKNKGRGRLISILNQKIDDARDSLKDTFNAHLMAAEPAAGSKDPISIKEIIQNAPGTNPARIASVGNLGGSANTWWRNKFVSGGPFLVADMNTMFNNVSDGTEPPTFLMTSQTVFEYYENSQVGLIRYSDTKMADAGFQNLMYKNVPIFWEPGLGVDSIYFINTSHLKLGTNKGADFVMSDFVKPENQAARTAQILWMGNLTCRSRRRQGVIFSITAPA